MQWLMLFMFRKKYVIQNNIEKIMHKNTMQKLTSIDFVIYALIINISYNEN